MTPSERTIAWAKANPLRKRALDSAYRKRNYPKIRHTKARWNATNRESILSREAKGRRELKRWYLNQSLKKAWACSIEAVKLRVLLQRSRRTMILLRAATAIQSNGSRK